MTKLLQAITAAVCVMTAGFLAGCHDDAGGTPESPADPNVPRADVDSGHEFELREVGTGTEGEDGWVNAKSSTAGFRVLLPGKYNDFQQSVKTVKGNQLTTHHVGMTTSRGVKYSVTAFQGGDPKPKDEILAGIVAGFGENGTVREQRELEYEGNAGVQFVTGDSSSGATVRAYAFDDMFYLLIAEYPAALASSEAGNLEKFLSSFRPR